jgi:hypothetical protein
MLLLCRKDIEGSASRYFSSERVTETSTSASSGHSYNLNFRRILPSFLSFNNNYNQQLRP